VKSRTGNLASNLRHAPRAGRTGFTLIELMVVMIIIILLLGILGPAANNAYRTVERSAAMAYVHLIESAVDAYKNDFDQILPPSRGTQQFMSGYGGAELLYLLLTGPAGDPDGNGIASKDFNLDDGLNGWGFRLRKRGKTYGPYIGAEQLPVVEKDGKRVFGDKWDNPILYYRFDTAVSKYHGADNTGGPADINAYATIGGVYARRDYLLIATGPDRKWQTEPGASSDDITNMKE